MDNEDRLTENYVSRIVYEINKNIEKWKIAGKQDLIYPEYIKGLLYAKLRGCFTSWQGQKKFKKNISIKLNDNTNFIKNVTIFKENDDWYQNNRVVDTLNTIFQMLEYSNLYPNENITFKDDIYLEYINFREIKNIIF